MIKKIRTSDGAEHQIDYNALANLPTIPSTPSQVGAMPNVAVTTSDNGKFLRVVSGKWAAATISSAEGASF